MRILVAGVGNVLKGDDGFGVRAAQALQKDPRLTADTIALETGIGGMHLVQELMQGYDAVILLDAFDRGGTPGQLFLLEPEVVPSVDESADQRVHHARLGEALERLPLRQRVAFTLRYLEGFSLDEVAESMAIDRGTVRVHVQRAVKALRANGVLE